MEWTVIFHEEFDPEFEALSAEVQNRLYAESIFLKRLGPQASRPQVDTLKGSRFANMKELRFEAAGGVWRVAFAFDPKRRAILLVAGDKAGISEKSFYQRLITKADQRYTRHLAQLKTQERKQP